jgi:hypothetical protein
MEVSKAQDAERCLETQMDERKYVRSEDRKVTAYIYRAKQEKECYRSQEQQCVVDEAVQ